MAGRVGAKLNAIRSYKKPHWIFGKFKMSRLSLHQHLATRLLRAARKFTLVHAAGVQILVKMPSAFGFSFLVTLKVQAYLKDQAKTFCLLDQKVLPLFFLLFFPYHQSLFAFQKEPLPLFGYLV